MTLKEELEILRGEPIQVFDGDPMDIPCIETSDAEKLCKHPVVSVHMITYNHEPYIREAIEGVMMQQTDFEFELIIGEDCSQDKTRVICFEYQKKYPDKIRVLWWHENVSKLGGNSRRVFAHCRGEFIALCEGDDYWIDPLKLQKQVDVMRRHPNVGLCFTGSKILQHETREWSQWDEKHIFKTGLMSGKLFFKWHCCSRKKGQKGPETFIMTATTLFREEILQFCYEKYDIFKWRLFLGDTTLWLGLSSLSDVYYLEEKTSVYRKNRGGFCATVGAKVCRDATLVRFYYLNRQKYKIPLSLKENMFMYWLSQFIGISKEEQKRTFKELQKCEIFKKMCKSLRFCILFYIFKQGLVSTRTVLWLNRYFYYSRNTCMRLFMRLITLCLPTPCTYKR